MSPFGRVQGEPLSGRPLRPAWVLLLLLAIALCRPASSGDDGAPAGAAQLGRAAPATKDGGGANEGRAQEGRAQEGEDGDEDETFLRGADLPTDFEADRLLKRARELLEPPEPQYHKAALVLQHLIDNAGNALATEDNLIYHPVRRKAERLLAELPEVGLETYRAEVDGQVQALLGALEHPRDEQALAAVAERYFLSSRGDDAAFVLGCLYLDQHQYLRARRLFLRILRHHPEASVPRGAVLVRLALACHRSGDAEGAREAWAQLQDSRNDRLSPAVVAAVRREVVEGAPKVDVVVEDGTRPTAGGRFADVPPGSLERPRGLQLVDRQHDFDLMPPSSNVRIHIAGRSIQPGGQASGAIRGHLAARWEECGWSPTGSMLFRDGLAYFKSHHGVVCLDPATGKTRWEAKPEAPTQTRTSYVSFSGGAFGNRAPTQPYEVMLFGDRLGKAVAVLGDTLYHIGDHHQASWAHQSIRRVVVVNGKQVVQEQKQTAQGNRLVALDAATGKVRWERGRTLDEKDPLRAVRFLAVPIQCGGRLLVPVESRNEMALVALEPDTGELVWRVFLCAYTASMQAPWHGVGLARHGSEVFVSTGQGVVLALDGIDGDIRWASRYPRTFLEGSHVNMFYQRGVGGWHENRVLPSGPRVAVLPSDAEQILVFDAHSGQLAQRLPSGGMRYCLGADGGDLFVGSDAKVRRIELESGKARWEVGLGGSRRGYGRGFLAADALYVPSGRDILRIAADTGRTETRLRAALPDEELVGSLFSDGQRFMVYGLGRVYSLKSGATEMILVGKRLADLEKQHAAADPPPPELPDKLAAAYLARAALHLGYGRVEKAADDYRTILHKLPKTKSTDPARADLFRTLMELAAEHPDTATARIREALGVAASQAHKAEALRALAADFERKGEIEDAARTLLSIARPTQGALLELAVGKDTWKARPDVLAAAGIRRLAAAHGDLVAAVLAERSAAALKAAHQEPSFAAYQTVLRAYPATPAAIEAGLRAAELDIESDTIERAELILREMALAEHRPTAAAGLARLAALHESRKWFRQAHAEWARLAKHFADVSVPVGGGVRKVGELAARHLADPAVAAAGEAPQSSTPKPPWRRIWEYKSDGKVPYINAVSYANSQTAGQADASEFLEQHLFLLERYKASKVVCKRLHDGKTVYERDIGSGRNQYPVCPEANLVAWSGSGGTTVYGLVSGKELWTQKGGPSPSHAINLVRSSSFGQAQSPTTTVLVVRPDSSTIRVLDLATGGVLWERGFRGRSIGWARDAGRYLVIAESRNQQLWITDAFTGEMLTTIQLKGRYLRMPHAMDNALLCESYGQGGQRILTLYELPSGKTVWQHDTKQPLRATYVLDDRTACLHLTNGDLHLVELATGKVRSKIEDLKTEGHVVRVVPDPRGKRLYLQVYGNDRKTRLEIVDLATGKKVKSVVYGTGISYGLAQMSFGANAGDLIPVIVREPPTKEGNRVRASQLSAVKFIEASTGVVREELKLPVGREDGLVDKLRQVIVQDDVIVLVGYNWIMAFGHDDGTPLPKPPPPPPKQPTKPKPSEEPKPGPKLLPAAGFRIQLRNAP